MMPSVVLSLSGGMDSTALLYHLLHAGYNVHTIMFTYGSKHNPYEEVAGRNVVEYTKEPSIQSKYVGTLASFTPIDLTSAFGQIKSNLMQSGGAIPEGHYEAPTMTQTVVPGRNIIFGAIAAGHAWSQNAHAIVLGVHAGDHAIYEDCREDFITKFKAAIKSGTGDRVNVVTPFLLMDKGEIARRGTELGAPFHLTRTCYKDQAIACGKCGSCSERIEAFALYGLKDPIPYQTEIAWEDHPRWKERA